MNDNTDCINCNVQLTDEMYRIIDTDYRLVERLEDVYGIDSIDYDDERCEYIFAEPVQWIYEEDRYLIKQEDFN